MDNGVNMKVCFFLIPLLVLLNPFLVDYILFMKANVTLDVNPNEIRDVKYVTPEELKAMFADPSKLFIVLHRVDQ